MIYLFSAIFGIIQGLTEFLPISSTAHLVILHAVWPLGVASDLGFDVILHSGTLVALLAFFWREIVRYGRAWFASLSHWNLRADQEQRLAWLIILGTLPAVLFGYILESFIENQFRSLWVIVITLVVGALLLWLAERLGRKEKGLDGVGVGAALTVGLAQALALVPGISRSGITIIAGLFLGLKRETAARFAFLLSIPIIFGAGLKKTLELIEQGALLEEPAVYLVGFCASAVSGYFCIKYFLRYLQFRSLHPFVLYRLLLALALIILLSASILR